MKTYKDMSFVGITEADVDELTVIMKRAFDEDSMLHLGKAGGPPGYDNGDFIRRWGFDSGVTSYKIIRDGNVIGMIMLWINNQTNENTLGTIFIDSALENKGIGKQVWEFVEKEYPNTIGWHTETPIFSHRNHNFYVNKLGFHVVKIENPREWNSGEGQFILEKRMKY